MSYFGTTPGYAHKYIATDQPLYGLGGIPGVNTSGWGSQRPTSLGNPSQTVDGLGSLGAFGEDPAPGKTVAPAGFSMPAGLKSIWFDEAGVPRAESQSYLAKFFGRMVDASGALYQGIICDNVAGAATPGASMDASQAVDAWSKAGFFVIASQNAAVCDASKGAYGKATWTVYRLPKERLAEIVGAPVFVVRMPFDKVPTAASWAEYAPYLMAPVGPDGKSGGTPVPVQSAGISGTTLVVGGIVAFLAYWWMTHERYESSFNRNDPRAMKSYETGPGYEMMANGEDC